MTLSATSLAYAETPQSDRDWMRDRTVVHKIVIALSATHPALSDLLDELARAQGALQSLNVRPVAGRFEAVLHASRLSPDAARRLVDRYAGLPEIASASIEHMLVR
jgi:hypothetical protein